MEFPANSYKSFCIHFYASDATTTSMHENTPMCLLQQCKDCSGVVGWGREGGIGRQDGMGREGLPRGGGLNIKYMLAYWGYANCAWPPHDRPKVNIHLKRR